MSCNLLSNVTVGPGPSYMSFESCGLLKSLTISCDKPIGLFGAEDGVFFFFKWAVLVDCLFSDHHP